MGKQPCPQRLHRSLGHMDAQCLVSAREHELSLDIPVVVSVEALPSSDGVSPVGNIDAMRPLDIVKFSFHGFVLVSDMREAFPQVMTHRCVEHPRCQPKLRARRTLHAKH